MKKRNAIKPDLFADQKHRQTACCDTAVIALFIKNAANQWNPDDLQRLGDDYSGADGGVVHRNRIVAYALYESASNIDDVGSVNWQPPFTKAQIKTAKALEQRMSKIGVSATIDEYLKSTHESK